MPRYNETPNIRDVDGQRIKSTWIYVAPPKTSSDIYIRIVAPDRLDRLANEFYTSQFDWPIIAAANGIGKGTLWVKSNTVLRIPNTDNINITDYIKSINKSR
jgi:hypothetical protein